jgi:hypothetical protein
MPTEDWPHDFGCPYCYGEDAEAVARRTLKREHALIDESHFFISIVRCPECGQCFVSIFTELIDWEDGDDAQYSDVLPVTDQEAEMLAAQGAAVDIKYIEALGEHRRRLKMDSPTGGDFRARWTEGMLWIYPGG